LATFGFTFSPLFSRETRESTKITPNAPRFSRLISPRLQLAEAICTAIRESCNAGKISIFVTTAWLQCAYSGSGNKHAHCVLGCLTLFSISNRAFDQLVVVLGRFQTKIKSETNKKSSEILAATGEIIRQHLEGVEMQMQADV
jgi:hypothetical protein